MMAPHVPVISIVIWKQDALLLATLYSSLNQQLFKTIKVATMTISVTNESHHVPYHKINSFCGEQRWMGHKEGHW